MAQHLSSSLLTGSRQMDLNEKNTRQQPVPVPSLSNDGGKTSPLLATTSPAFPFQASALCSTNSSNTTRGTSFLDLPAEVRNKIYELTLCHWRGIHLGGSRISRYGHVGCCDEDRTCGWDSDSLHKTKIHSHITVALLRASKQIHHEGTPMLYGRNSFFCSDYWRVHDWAKQIRASFGLLRTLELPVENLTKSLQLRWFPVKASQLKDLTLTVCAFRSVSIGCVARHLACFLVDDAASDGHGCDIEVVEDAYSKYVRSLGQDSSEHGGFGSYGDEVRAELRKVMMSRMKIGELKACKEEEAEVVK